MINLIAFDADDTLWHNENIYAWGRERFGEIIAPYLHGVDVDSHLNQTELCNLKYYGYGVMSFTFSLIETAIELTVGKISAVDIKSLLDLSKEMIASEVHLFDDARATLDTLSRKFPLMLITKGELLHQQSKIARSGIRDYFRFVEIVSDKTRDTYAEILHRHNMDASGFLMVGNSLRSDILPVIELGGWGVYIPNELTWSHEMSDPPSGHNGRYIEIARLGLVPDVINRINQKT
jgi:putative hydrolase of the HAD superfamily